MENLLPRRLIHQWEWLFILESFFFIYKAMEPKDFLRFFHPCLNANQQLFFPLASYVLLTLIIACPQQKWMDETLLNTQSGFVDSKINPPIKPNFHISTMKKKKKEIRLFSSKAFFFFWFIFSFGQFGQRSQLTRTIWRSKRIIATCLEISTEYGGYTLQFVSIYY